MNNLILKDRITGLNVSIGFEDGLLTYADTVEDFVIDPIIADQIDNRYWTLFVSDGVIGHEEATTASPGFIEIEDSVTGVDWRFQVLSGVLGYIHIIGVSASIESVVTDESNLESIITDGEAKESRQTIVEDLSSIVYTESQNGSIILSDGRVGSTLPDDEMLSGLHSGHTAFSPAPSSENIDSAIDKAVSASSNIKALDNLESKRTATVNLNSMVG